jgi:hypothetical protein
MAVKAVYNISWSDFYIKAELIEQFQLGAKVQFDGEAKNTVSAKNLPGVGALISRFSKVPFPASFPIMMEKTMKPTKENPMAIAAKVRNLPRIPINSRGL